MNITPVFAHFIAEDMLDLDNDKLKKYCLSLKKKSKGRNISNLGGWQSDDVDLKAPCLQALLHAVESRIRDLNATIGFEDVLVRPSNGWININNMHDSNIPHCHPGAFFSAVYYIDGGNDKGDLIFLNPFPFFDNAINKNIVKTYTIFNSLYWFHKPITGKILIFPAWLMHYVKPNVTEQDRISIALNFTIGDFH